MRRTHETRFHYPFNIFDDDIEQMTNDSSEHPAATNHRAHAGQETKLEWLGELTANIIHELRNPLTVLSLSLSTLESGLEKTPENDEALRAARNSIQRMTNIVNSTLDFMRNEWDDLQPLNVQTLVDETMPIARAAASGKKIEFQTTFASNEPITIKGDFHQLQQALINLVGNSIDAIPESGTVSIRIAPLPNGEKQKSVQMEIADTGIGISESDLARIFTPFFSRKANGTGLGLAISKTILDRHHASVSVTSAIGKGTTFTIIFLAVS